MGEKQAVTPLVRMLADVSIEHLFHFMARMKLRWTLVCQRNGTHCEARIMKDGMVTYAASSGLGAGTTMRLVIAKFLVGEQKDIHDL